VTLHFNVISALSDVYATLSDPEKEIQLKKLFGDNADISPANTGGSYRQLIYRIVGLRHRRDMYAFNPNGL
jgi:hypothetical protein